jgi:PAS domain S-box-containing protein
MRDDAVNILLVDDQPAKLLSYEVILRDLGERLLQASSAREALEQLLRRDVAVLLVDVCMPELDGFQLAAMVREHPRFQQTAIIFVSAIHLSDVDRLRGYEMGAVDYVPVPVVPEVLRAKVRVFAELFRKTRQLERLNHELEERVAERTAELEASTARLIQSEELRSLALAAGQMGSWDWDAATGECHWDAGQYRIFGVDPAHFAVTPENVRALIHPEDWQRLRQAWDNVAGTAPSFQTEFRVRRPNGELRWCIGTVAARFDELRQAIRLSGVTADITERREAEERQALLAREVDHRARNALAVAQSIVRLTRASSVDAHVRAVEGRIRALSRAHVLLSESRWQGADLARLVEEELAPYRLSGADRIVASGPEIVLQPATAQTFALALHELATNAAKYGALSGDSGQVRVTWVLRPGSVTLEWCETDGPAIEPPREQGYGTRLITASIERQLGGRAVFEWHPQGLLCRLTVPRSGGLDLHEPQSALRRASEDGHGRAPPQIVRGNRVLLVEDEALVAMMMKDMLAELGYDVLGAFGSTAEAVSAALANEIDAGILDVNLGGDMVYPVADLLARRGVPFVFVTGYGAESIDGRYAQVPVLQKPIERDMLERIFVAGGNGRAAMPLSQARRRTPPRASQID